MTGWSDAPERGAGWLVRLMLWLLRHAGWFATGIVLPGISAWFFLFSPKARAASREFLTAALPRPATSLDVLRHIHVFACAILDRTLLLTRPSGVIALDVEGLHHVQAAIDAGRGCILMGAHLGSFAVLRELAERCPVPVHMLMYRNNAGVYSSTMEALDPALARGVIPIGDVQSMLRAHDAVAAGAIVGVLADRSPAGTKRIGAVFFGRPALFPTGPFILAASLSAPVLLFSGVRTGPRRYAVTFQPFTERVVLRRAARQADLARIVQDYASWLEAACQAHPFNWFNFFPFWERAPHAPTNAAARPAERALLGAKPRAAAG